jgi:hypothetical protein
MLFLLLDTLPIEGAAERARTALAKAAADRHY